VTHSSAKVEGSGPWEDVLSFGMAIRDEQPGDHAAIAALHKAAFGRDYEAALVARLRHEHVVHVSLVADAGEEIIGHILFSALSVQVDDRHISAAALAPLSIAPRFQRQGHGSLLVEAGIAALRLRGGEAIIVLGHPDFYPRFGFSARMASHLRSPFRGPAFMALELVPGALAGRAGSVTYPGAFGLGP
jgi:putative acetyltransferase